MDTKEELTIVLRTHAEKYALMQPVDVVKLLYQNEFGGGHLITDEKQCLERIKKEYMSIEHIEELPLNEEIGNGMIRVNLAAVSDTNNLDRLCEAFIQSSVIHQGNLESFKRKLNLLVEVSEQFVFSFGKKELEEYLDEYAKAGYPMVSHSAVYREAYHPAYRVVCNKLWLIG